MGYEQMKRWGFERKKRQFQKSGQPWTPDVDKLVRGAIGQVFMTDVYLGQSNTAYTIMSGASKLEALAITYPYQVVRSRIQVYTALFLTIRLC